MYRSLPAQFCLISRCLRANQFRPRLKRELLRTPAHLSAAEKRLAWLPRLGLIRISGARLSWCAWPHVESAEVKAVVNLVRNLSVLNAAIVVGMVAYAQFIGLPAAQIILLVITATLAAVPVALPATFTLGGGAGCAEACGERRAVDAAISAA
jgi:hypothetical protein